MNRRKLLSTLGVFPLALLAISCERKIFSRPTIITGKVIDQDGNPLKGVPFDFEGFKKTTISGVPTFLISAKSDSAGQYQLSQNIPKGTDAAWFFLRGNEKVRPVFSENNIHEPSDYKVYVQKDGNYELLTGDLIDILRSQWGKTNTFNFKYEKI